MSENVGSIVYEIDANTSGLVAANKQVDTANKKIQSGFAKTDKAMAATVKGSGKLSNSIRQASMQLSQVAQQGSVTGNYLQALAIQLPDLALGFGTVGIIAGALAGSLAVPLYNAITGVDEKTKSYNKTIEETVAGLKSVRLETTISTIDQLTKSIEENNGTLEELEVKRERIRGKSSRGGTNQRLNEQYDKEEKELLKTQERNNEALRVLIAERKKIESEQTPEEKAATKKIEAEKAAFDEKQKLSAQAIEQIKKQFQDEQTLADEQLIERLAAIDDAEISIAEKEQAEYEARALHAQRLADLDAKRTTDEQAETAKRLTLKKMELAAYTQLGGQLTNLVAAAGAENTAIGKAVFLANQALAVAGIIVNTQAAAAAALAQGGPIAGPALAANVTTLGYTSAAIAAGVAVGQTFSGRQTGGPTEANTPYRIGEAGPELFTSGGRQFLIGGEKGNVTPTNQLGGAAAPQVNVVVNNNTSSNVSVSQEQDGNNVTIQMLVADFAEGGPVSRAMSSSYNTKRKTT